MAIKQTRSRRSSGTRTMSATQFGSSLNKIQELLQEHKTWSKQGQQLDRKFEAIGSNLTKMKGFIENQQGTGTSGRTTKARSTSGRKTTATRGAGKTLQGRTTRKTGRAAPRTRSGGNQQNTGLQAHG